jgi:hypothetical protein
MWLLGLEKFVHPWPKSMSVEERLAIVSARLYTLSHEEYINLHTNSENCFQQQQISGHTLNLNEQDALQTRSTRVDRPHLRIPSYSAGNQAD